MNAANVNRHAFHRAAEEGAEVRTITGDEDVAFRTDRGGDDRTVFLRQPVGPFFRETRRTERGDLAAVQYGFEFGFPGFRLEVSSRFEYDVGVDAQHMSAARRRRSNPRMAPEDFAAEKGTFPSRKIRICRTKRSRRLYFFSLSKREARSASPSSNSRMLHFRFANTITHARHGRASIGFPYIGRTPDCMLIASATPQARIIGTVRWN